MADLTCLSLRSPISALDNEHERGWQLREFCTPMLLAVQQPSDHFKRLDTHLSTLLPHALRKHPGSASSSPPGPEDSNIFEAQAILSRLACVPSRSHSITPCEKETGIPFGMGSKMEPGRRIMFCPRRAHRFSCRDLMMRMQPCSFFSIYKTCPGIISMSPLWSTPIQPFLLYWSQLLILSLIKGLPAIP